MSDSIPQIAKVGAVVGVAALTYWAGFNQGRRKSIQENNDTLRQLVRSQQEKADLEKERNQLEEKTARLARQARDGHEVAEGAVVIVDPLSTGAVLAAEFIKKNYEVVRLMSQRFPERFGNFIPATLKRTLRFVQSFEFKGGSLVDSTFEDDVDACVKKLRELHLPIVTVIAGAETGVEVCDAVAQRLGLPNNGPSMSHVRRNKYLMGEQVRRAGIRAVRQARVRKWEEVAAFLGELQPDPFRVVIKPISSAGSDGVMLCRSESELKDRFTQLIGAQNVFGMANESCVVQEYLEGKEYVIDTVSRAGLHKVVAVWEYDKRQANGRDFIYHGMRLISGDDRVAQSLIHYMKKVLDALNIVNSPGHGEVMLTSTGPCLVEVGARCHGGEGIWIPMAQACLGYTQLSACILAHTDEKEFRRLPDVPILHDTFAMECMLVSRVAGVLRGLPKLKDLEALPSFHSHALEIEIGKRIEVTVDYLTTPGSVILISKSREQLERDYTRIRDMELDGFFIVE